MARVGFSFVIVPLLIFSPGVRLGEERPDLHRLTRQVSETNPFKDPRVQKVKRLLEELQRNHASGKRTPKDYTVTDLELNAYLAERLQDEARKGVESLSVRFQRDSFMSSITLDLDEVEVTGNSLTLELFSALLSGYATIEMEGRLSVENGKGTLIIDAARINSRTVPPSLVQFILSEVGKRQNPPFDPTDSFRMPYGIRNVKIEPGKAILYT